MKLISAMIGNKMTVRLADPSTPGKCQRIADELVRYWSNLDFYGGVGDYQDGGRRQLTAAPFRAFVVANASHPVHDIYTIGGDTGDQTVDFSVPTFGLPNGKEALPGIRPFITSIIGHEWTHREQSNVIPSTFNEDRNLQKEFFRIYPKGIGAPPEKWMAEYYNTVTEIESHAAQIALELKPHFHVGMTLADAKENTITWPIIWNRLRDGTSSDWGTVLAAYVDKIDQEILLHLQAWP